MRPPVLDLELFEEEEARRREGEAAVEARRRSATFMGKTLRVMASLRSLAGRSVAPGSPAPCSGYGRVC
jgi:hypothetical protein